MLIKSILYFYKFYVMKYIMYIFAFNNNTYCLTNLNISKNIKKEM